MLSDSDLVIEIEQYIDDFTRLMDVLAEVRVSVKPADDENRKVVSIEYDGNDLGYMIGNRGAHLKGLQYILSMLINKKFVEDGEERLYVNVDVSGYKRGREDKVQRMALRMADDARALGESLDMEPMSASERRVVHMALSKFDDVSTESYGEGRDRYLKIIPKTEVELGLMEDEVVDELLEDVGDGESSEE